MAGDKATAHGPFTLPFLKIISALSGRKIWRGSQAVEFDATPANVRYLKVCDFPTHWEDRTGTIAKAEALEDMPTQHDRLELATKYEPRTSWRKHQRDTLAVSASRKVYAHLHEMGLGKTAITIAEAAMLFLEKKLTGVLVIAPKGVHRQWVEEQIPVHLSERVPWRGLVWSGKVLQPGEMNTSKRLTFLTMNVDSVRTPNGFKTAETFLKLHPGKAMMVLDESHNFKNWAAARTKAVWQLGELAAYRRIMTGTLIAKNILDAWSQFKFLDVNILGHKYMASFRSRYCVMGGFEGRQIVAQKNTEEFYRLIAPHCFRLTKREALDLPPKVYAVREYEMGEKTKRHYDSMKHSFMTALDNGEIVDVANAATLIPRLQQILCGYLPFDDGEQYEIFSDERLDVLTDIANQIDGKTIVWAWFIEDGRRITERLNAEFGEGSAVHYRGATRADAKRDFIARPDVRFFVANQAAAGAGTDGLQKVCSNAIYYSQPFRSLDRWQSEDRIDRMGMIGAASYFDIVAYRSVDRSVLRNLRSKKSVADLTLDDIRQMINSD